MPKVFPRHWNQCLGDMVDSPGGLFNNHDITYAFTTLMWHGKFPQHRLCFFIDGLDEYHGESRDQVMLAKSLQQWASQGDAKFLASSRPELEFDSVAKPPVSDPAPSPSHKRGHVSLYSPKDGKRRQLPPNQGFLSRQRSAAENEATRDPKGHHQALRQDATITSTRRSRPSIQDVAHGGAQSI